MTEAELKKHRCCFTGHRPEKLTIPERQLEKLLEAEIRRAIHSSHTTFISGMAKGVDIIAAEIVLRLPGAGPTAEAHLRTAIPRLWPALVRWLDGAVSAGADLG